MSDVSPALPVAVFVGILAAVIAVANGQWWAAIGPGLVAVGAACVALWQWWKSR